MKKTASLLLIAALLAGCASRSFSQCYESGLQAYNSGNYETAIEDLTEAVKKDANRNPDVILLLADSYIRSGNTEQARTVLQEGIEATGSTQLKNRLASLDNPRQEEVLFSEVTRNNSGSFISAVEYEYDQQGRPARIIHMNEDGTIGDLYNLLIYDEDGNLAEDSTYTIGHPSSLVESIGYEYENGHLSKELFYGSDMKLLSYNIYEYEDDLLMKKTFYYEQGTVMQWYYLYTYEDGVLTEESWYSPGDELQNTVIYEYDSGKLIREQTIHPENGRGMYILYEYDKKGRLILKTSYQSSGSVYNTVSYTYQ